jgi:hypothetical protein
MKKFTFIILLLSLFQVSSFSQTSVSSTNGYQVNLNVYPAAIVPTSSSCTWGYNYVVKMAYNITLTGNNVPGSLYTLQGTVGCGSSAIFFDLPNNGGSGNVNSSNAWTSAKNCATVTVPAMGCNTVNIQISGPGISYRTVSFSPATALSVKLVSFEAAVENNKVKINWTTATETDNNYFTIERSVDGANWKEIKKINGAGNSSTALSYQAYDEAPVTGTSYYRLKQTDFDGKTSYSATEIVKFASLSNGISIFPVPNTGNNININGISDYKKHDLSVLNASGKILFTTTLNKSSVDLPSLQPGVYVIRITDKVSGEAKSMRYIKM